MAAVAGNPSVTCGDSSAQDTPFGCPKGEPRNTNLQTPYKIKSPACTRKHLNITLPIPARATIGVGKPQADSEERANSAGRFRHGCPRNYAKNSSSWTSLRGDVGIAPYTFQEIHLKHQEHQKRLHRNPSTSFAGSPSFSRVAYAQTCKRRKK